MRRLTLLIGMVLHLVGVAAVPFHVWEPAGPGPDAVSASERRGDGSSLPVHDELHCVLCHAAATLALPAESADFAVAADADRAETPAPLHALPFRPASPARARAPPLA
jgi:hypothetical protein